VLYVLPVLFDPLSAYFFANSSLACSDFSDESDDGFVASVVGVVAVDVVDADPVDETSAVEDIVVLLRCRSINLSLSSLLFGFFFYGDFVTYRLGLLLMSSLRLRAEVRWVFAKNHHSILHAYVNMSVKALRGT